MENLTIFLLEYSVLFVLPYDSLAYRSLDHFCDQDQWNASKNILNIFIIFYIEIFGEKYLAEKFQIPQKDDKHL